MYVNFDEVSNWVIYSTLVSIKDLTDFILLCRDVRTFD